MPDSTALTTRAAVFTAPGQPLELCDVVLPTLQNGEALVRVTCCTICGSDLHSFTGRRPVPTPTILGHEIIGIVERIPDPPLCDARGNPLEVGDRLVWSVAACCGTCRNCRREIPQKCDDLHKYGHHQLEDNWSLSGGLAQHCHLRTGTAAIKVDASIPDEVLCPASCATSTCAAALRTADDVAGDGVLIFGAGMLGLTMTAMAKSAGAASVTVCDINADRRALAGRFGADNVVDWNDLTCEMARSDSGCRFEAIFEMTGQSTANQAAIDLAAVGARIVLVGSVLPTPAISLDPEQVVRRLLNISGVHNYRPDDLLTAVDFLAGAGCGFPFGELVERSFSLSDVHAAFDYAVQHKPIRVAVKP